MGVLIRVDVDRPYGKQPIFRHALSRIASDWYLPRLPGCGYLRETERLLELLEEWGRSAWFFFRRCTFPGPDILARMARTGSRLGVHLEDTRDYGAFACEIGRFRRLGPVEAVSKHGSGMHTYGCRHYAPYEPERYVAWARRLGIPVVFGNGEAPSGNTVVGDGVTFYPDAFWLEPYWRDTGVYTLDWLRRESAIRDIPLLVHPSTLMTERTLLNDFREVLSFAQG